MNLAGVMDKGQFRSILYQGSLSELFVPYMGKDEPTNSRVFIDSGEFYAATGGFIKPLAPGIDCPPTAQYFAGTFYAESGAPASHSQLACLYERTSGDPSWRHGEGGVAGRPSRQLVLRSAAVIGNYDYMVDWRFQENGSITVGVAATGVVETTSTDRDPSKEVAMAGMIEYGHLVDKNIEAINHDHFFSFRLDIDVDGSKNSFLVDRLVPQQLPPGQPRKSIWVMKSSIAPSETDAISDLDMHHPAMWRFINPAHRGPVGYPTSIEIMPGQTGISLLSPDDWPQKRAGFSAHTLWVTPYQPAERYAVGTYPTGSKGADGLHVWTKADRKIEDTDIVAWYTMGFHHVPRAEDWPVMPVMWHEFEIRPYDFFAHNPLMNRSMQP